jgi:hypothetical protein
MSHIREHLDVMLHEIKKLNGENHVTEADEFVAVNDVELAIYEARKTFERTKKIDEETT